MPFSSTCCFVGEYMKIKYSFESVDMGDEIILVPVGNSAKEVHGVVRANEAGNKIMQFLMQGMDEEGVVNSLAKEYENDRETLAGYVRSVIRVLQDNHFIE